MKKQPFPSLERVAQITLPEFTTPKHNAPDLASTYPRPSLYKKSPPKQT